MKHAQLRPLFKRRRFSWIFFLGFILPTLHLNFSIKAQASPPPHQTQNLSPVFSFQSPFEAPQPEDLPQNLLPSLSFLTLEQLREAGLESAKLNQSPWSGWYWPLQEGGLAYRYADPSFPHGSPWSTIFQYLKSHLGADAPSRFSPAEKYDRLLGDHSYSLTQAMLQLAEDHSSEGSIDGWMGYCTGWALASLMLPRPTHSVTLRAFDDQSEIEFLPSDIKALGSLLWATGSSPAQVVGTLCEESPVQRDPITGRPLHVACRDTNASTFHLVMTHLIGLYHRSFLMDSDSGYQIWNQPILNYSYSYFNPITSAAGPLESSKVPLREYKKDPFHDSRAPGTVSVIGIETHLTFIYETRPNAEKTDSELSDEQRHPLYRYELELDAQGKIMGGEWLTRLHPDLLWAPLPFTTPSTLGDPLVSPQEDWTPGHPLPPSWIQAAKKSQTQMQPLSILIQRLFEWSTQNP